MVSCDFPELAEIFWRDKGAPDKVKFVEVGNPHGILVISLLALDSPDVFRVGDNDMEMPFKDIKNGNSVFTSGFHTDLRAVIA